VDATFTAAEAAALVEGELVGEGAVRLTGIAPLDRAGPGDLSFLTSGQRYVTQFHTSRAGAVLCTPEHREERPGPATRIIVKNPHQAMLRAVRFLYPDPPRPTGIHPSAVIGTGAVLGADVHVGPYAVVGAGARIGDRTLILSHCVIGDGVTIGADCTLHPHVVCYPRAVVGDRVILHAGVRLASDGFGYQPGAAGHERVPHVARTVIEDDVEIGANSCVDRGSVSDTIIGAGTKVDNLVHVAHNVKIGKRCLLMALVGIAGSTIVEDDVIIAGQVGIVGHLTIHRGARLGAQSGVIGDVAAGATVSGYPAREHRDYMRAMAALFRLAPLARDLEALVERGQRETE